MEASDVISWFKNAEPWQLAAIIGFFFLLWLLLVWFSHWMDIAEGNVRQKIVASSLTIVIIIGLTLFFVWEHQQNYTHIISAFEYLKNRLV